MIYNKTNKVNHNVRFVVLCDLIMTILEKIK